MPPAKWEPINFPVPVVKTEVELLCGKIESLIECRKSDWRIIAGMSREYTQMESALTARIAELESELKAKETNDNGKTNIEEA